MKQFGKPAKNSIFQNIFEQPYNDRIRFKLYNSAKGNGDFVQRLGLQHSLAVHRGCVNCICWSDDGRLLLSGSDDQHLVVSHAYNYKTLTDYKTSHRANVFSAKFLPNSGDTNIVSCSGDGIILFTDLLRTAETRNNQFNCHKGTTYEIATVPNEPHTFLSCGEDYTVRCFDLRIKEKCDKDNCTEDVLISCQRAVTALSINNVRPYQMAIGCSDSTVRLFDRRMIGTKAAGFSRCSKGPRPFATFTAPGMEDRSYRITSLGFSPQGEDVLVSYSSEHLYLFSIKEDTAVELEPTAWEGEEDGEGGESKLSSGLPPVRRLRLRGDWSDTGPDARPEREGANNSDAGQARPTLHATLMQRMTDVLSRMLNDPATRAALSHGGEDDHHDYSQQPPQREAAEDLAVGEGSAEHPQMLAVSIEGIYNESDSPTRPDPLEGASSWEAMASDEPEPVSLPSFQSSFVAAKPTAAADNPQPSTSASESAGGSTSASASASASVASASTSASASVASASTSASASEASASTSASASESPTGSSSESRDNLTNLTDQLSTMRHGFIERHGTEPVVNLMYSDKGSTTSRISLSMADEVSREAVPQATTSTEVAGPSNQANTPPPPHTSDDSASEFGEDMMSDDESAVTTEQPVSGSHRCSSKTKSLTHEIEREMEEAVRNTHSSFEDKVKIRKLQVKQKYTGHRNARTMIKEATFWGNRHVLSGSDCGHVFVWDRETARLVMLLEADHHVVNCLQPHPFLPILATSGIDYDVKLWAPLLPEPGFNADMAEELVKRNEVMLEETKDTITVPASFMIRMLACLNQIRRGSRRPRRPTSNNDQH